MEALLKKGIEGLKLDRSDWQLVKFGDVAVQQKQTVDRENTDLIRYVKGEHMNSEDLKLRDWGMLTDEYLGPAFIRKFEEGDILYGSRRTYLRKVVIAPFDGITSNTTFVIRANEKRVDKRLLPFIMLSEGFSQHSIRNSKGSVNPYVNWKDLSGYEFLLPPKELQSFVADLLWSIDTLVENDSESLSKSKKYKESYFMNSIFCDSEKLDRVFGKRKSKHPVKKLGSLISKMQYGISENLSLDSGVPVLRMNNLQDGELEISNLKYFDFSKSDLEKYKLDKGDVLFNRTNSFDLVGKVSIFDQVGVYSFASYLLRITTKTENLDPRFLNFYLNLPIGMSKIRKYRTPGVSQSNINAQNLKQVPVPTPCIDFQKEVMDKVDAFYKAEIFLKEKIKSSKLLKRSLINQVF